VQFLDTLNADQRRAATYGIGSGNGHAARPLLVIAGAGSGKTTTLAARVAGLILGGVPADRILLLTFSRRAAVEMGERARRILAHALGAAGARRSARVSWSGTFHGVGARLLRIYAERIGLPPGFSIHDRADAEDLIHLVRHDLGLSEKAMRFPLKGTCLSIYSLALNSRQPLEDVLARHYPWCAGFEAELRELFEAYVAAKQTQGVLDYDDLLLYWSEMMKEPSVAAEIADRFDCVLVDEYQDTNPLQAEILIGLKPDGRGLTVVGDDAQAIYGFRAASVRNILDFPEQFPEPAELITLEQNYRSNDKILAASNAVIAAARERFTKDLRTERVSQQRPALVSVTDELAQARYVAEAIIAAREAGVALKSQAVLFRTSHHSGALEVELARRNIPFVKFGGLKFLEAAHIKDLTAILRWAENPRDRLAAFRTLQMMPGIGPTTAAKIFERVQADAFGLEALSGCRPPAQAGEIWPSFAELMGRLGRRCAGWPAELDEARTWYQPVLEERYPDAQIRAADLDQLAQIARQFASRERFLTELTLDPPDATSDEAGAPLLDEDYLILSTIHSAKGQEWHSVYLLNAVDGCIPSDMSTGNADDIEEERRLLYVAMTRAKETLHLVLPQRFYVHQQRRFGDRHVYAARSRFIGREMLAHFEQASWPARQRDMAGAGIPATGAGAHSVDLKSRIHAMWKAG
jgi:DNA helicase-2/ATP-dependent DNA helicase PcrA